VPTKRLPLGLISFPHGDILFDPENNRFLKLNETAIAMWLALSLKTRKTYIVNDVLMGYDITRQELRKDLDNLIRSTEAFDINPARRFWKIFSCRPIIPRLVSAQENLRYETPEIELLPSFSFSKTRKTLMPIGRTKKKAAKPVGRERRRVASTRSSHSLS
jgi:coenzyme PQQ synthesis protein D (PqqD)